MAVVDASILAKSYSFEAGSELARELLQKLPVIFLPAHALAETIEALLRKHRRGELAMEQVHIAARVVSAATETIPLEAIISDAAQIALEIDTSVYDALYLAAAKLKQCSVHSADERLRRKCQGTPYADLLIGL